MRKVFALLLSVVMAMGVLAGCGGKPSATDTKTERDPSAATSAATPAANPKQTSYPVTVKDSEGREVTLQAEPKRIVSVAPANTELVFALGKGSSIVAHSQWDDYPAEAKNIKEIVDWFQLDLEKLVALKPDLILVVGGSPEIRKRLVDQYKLTLFSVQPATFEDIYTVTGSLGVALNAQEQAQTVIAEMKKTVAEVSEKVARATSRPKVYLEASYDKDKGQIFTTGTGTFQDTLIAMAGGVNAAAEVKGGWVEYSLEKLAAADPDLIITSHVEVSTVKARTGWNNFKAVRENKVFGIEDGNLLVRPGPRLVLGLKWMAQTIHPELFK